MFETSKPLQQCKTDNSFFLLLEVMANKNKKKRRKKERRCSVVGKSDCSQVYVSILPKDDSSAVTESNDNVLFRDEKQKGLRRLKEEGDSKEETSVSWETGGREREWEERTRERRNKKDKKGRRQRPTMRE